MCLVLGMAVLLDICPVEANPQVQNCAFGNCNQNNFGRRRRQILEEILAEVEAVEDAKVVKRQAQNCEGSDCTQNNLGGPIAPGGPPPVPGAQVQNCQGSDCTQNNLGGPAPGPVVVQPPPPVVVQPPPPVVVQPPVPVVQPPPAVVGGPALPGSQVQNCQGSDCTQNNLGGPIAPGPVVVQPPPVVVQPPPPVVVQPPVTIVDPPPPPPVGGPALPGGAQVQNCQGSDCTQNNLGGPIAPGPVVVQPPVPVVQPPPAVVGPALPGGAGGAQVQNCQGSDCTQNNLGPIAPGQVAAPGPVPFPAGFPFAPGFPFTAGSPFAPGFPFGGAGAPGAGGAGAQVQNCQGSECTQNNLGRKKRQIADAINALTAEVLEAEDKAVAEDAVDSVSKRDADAQFQNCFGSACNQNNFGRRKREVIAALLEELL